MLSFKNRKNLYIFFVLSIIILLASSQLLVHLQLNKLSSDGELINDAGRMRMLSQRILQQSLRTIEGNCENCQIELCETVEIFGQHIARVNKGLDKKLYESKKNIFDGATSLAKDIENSGKNICKDSIYQEASIKKLIEIETSYIEAQNKFVETIQRHYESKISSLSTIEILLSILTIIIVLLEVWYIFIPMDRVNIKKTHELKKVLKLQREISRTVAHDLRSPISSIASIHHMIKDEVKFKSTDDKELFDAIGLAAENAIATASSMLVIYQGNAIKHTEQKEIQLGTLVKAQIRIISAIFFNKNRIIVQNTCKDCEVLINIHEISRMIQNILDNALKYSTEGVLVKVKKYNDFAIISVKDIGIGMSDSLIKWITDNSNDTVYAHSEKGFGLGMRFIKQTVIRHKGYIKVEKLSKGTIFTVGLPLLK